MSEDDLNGLPPEVRAAARCDANGEMSWPLDRAVAAVNALADAGRVILGLDLRESDGNGRFIEVPWSSYDGNDAEDARRAALHALDREDLPGEWVMVTWSADGQ